VDHRLTKILSARTPAFVPCHDLAPGAVVVEHVRVIDREVVKAAVRIVEWISPSAHHLINQAIGFENRSPGFVHKLRLHISPCCAESIRVLA
jgi:hypothetical protein